MNQIQHSGGQTAHTNSTNSVQTVSTTSGEANAWSARTSFLPAELVFKLVESVRKLSSISKQLGRRGLGLVHWLVSGAVTTWWGDEDGALAYQVSTASAVSELQVVWPWIRSGDLVVPTYDFTGEIVGWRLWTNIKIKDVDRFAPCRAIAWATKDAVFADYFGLAMLRGECEPDYVCVVEGEPDFLSAATVAAALWFHFGIKVAVLGVVAGSWTAEFAKKIPKSSIVILATDHDKAGSGYAGAVRKDLPPEQTVLRWSPKVKWGKGDVNDYWKTGFGGWRLLAKAAVEGKTASEEQLNAASLGIFSDLPAPPTPERERWAWSDNLACWTEHPAWASWTTASKSLIREARGENACTGSEYGWTIARAFNWRKNQLFYVAEAWAAGASTHGTGGCGWRALQVLRAAAALEGLVHHLDDAQRDHCAQAQTELAGALATLKRAADAGARNAKTKGYREKELKSLERKAKREPMSEWEVLRPITKADSKRPLARNAYKPAPAASAPKPPTQAANQAQKTANEGKAGGDPPSVGTENLNFEALIAELTARYLPRNLLTERMGEVWRTITLQSPQNTGKTEVLKELVAQAKAKGLRVLILTHRRTLARQLANRLGALCYLDRNHTTRAFAIEPGQALVMSLDSLPKRLLMNAGGSGLPDLVLIDESEQVSRHLFAKTIGDNLQQVADDLHALLKGCARVVCADADAGKSTADLLAWADRAEGHRIINRWARWTFNLNKTNLVRVLRDGTNNGRLQLWAQIEREVQVLKPSDPPLMVACTSCGEARRLSTHLAQVLGYESADAARADQKIICITGNSKDGVREQRFLEQPNEELRKWRVVIYTPALGTGFSLESVVQRVFMIGTAVEGITGPDIVQLMTRARNQQQPATLWLESRVFEDLPCDIDQAQRFGKLLLEEHASSIGRIDGKRSAFVRGQFRARLADREGSCAQLYKLWLCVIAETGRMGRNPSQTALETLRERGARVVFAEGDAPLDHGITKQIKEKIKEEDAQGIFAALPLSPDEDIEHLRQISTKEARHKVAHHDIEKRLRRPVTLESAKAEVERGALAAGRKLATAAVVFEGGEDAGFLAQQAETKIVKSLAVPDRHKTLAQSLRTVDILAIAGLEDLLKQGAAQDDLSIDAPLRLACLRAYGEKHREALTAIGLKPPKKDCQEDRKDAETLRWLVRVLKRVGFQVETRRASGAAQRKGHKARTYFVNLDAAQEAWRWAEVPLAEMKSSAERDRLSWGLPA
jgi:hypothetical protein